MTTAVVLFNLGAPDGPAAVEPFLKNLFSDPAILRVPGILRPLLARFIAHRRAPAARKIYEALGGGSPLRPETDRQAAALGEALAARKSEIGDVRVFVAMRYWHPLVEDVARAVVASAPERIVALPLYPQFSTTTTASSLGVWRRAMRAAGCAVPVHGVCCYPASKGWIDAQAALLAETLEQAPAGARVLFSAHGLPQSIVDAGDPYPWQVERTADALVAELAARGRRLDDWTVCYQSRVGPLKWLGPYAEEEIRRAGRDGVPLVVVPVSFVSEHSETLVELDITYRDLAASAGVPAYLRVPAVGTHPQFIAALADLVVASCAHRGLASAEGGRICPADRSGCALAQAS